MNLKLALPNGRVIKVKAEFPYTGSPIGYRVLLKGYTAIVVGLAEEGEEIELQFPDKKPITKEKHISSILDTANYYALLPWVLLFDLLPSVFDWREEKYIILEEKEEKFIDKLSLKVLEYVKNKRKVKEESIKNKFGKEIVEKLIDIGLLKKERIWEIPSLSTTFYSLALPVELALEKLRRFKNKEEKLRLIYYLQERIKSSLEELKEAGFKGKDIKALVKRGILLEKEETIDEIRKIPYIKQEKREYLKPLGSKSVLFGQWDRVRDTLASLLSKLIEGGKSAFVFCNSLRLLEKLYEYLYPLLGDRLVFLSSQMGEKEFIKRWFYFADADGIVLLGSKISLLSPMKRMDLLVYFDDFSSNPWEKFDIRHFLYNLSKYYAANFLYVASMPPLSLCQKEDWEKIYEPPAPEVLLFKRSFDEVLCKEAREIIQKEDKEWLFLVNKSGYAYAYCPKCGWIVECAQCGSFLTLSKDKDRVFCASCGYRGDALCLECGGRLEELGFGIDKAAEEIKNIFGNRENFYFDTIPRLGQTYENVLVLNADNILSVPWFDSEERYFHYLWQAMAICRKKLIVQTSFVETPLLEFLKNKDWQGFCNEELRRRKEEKLPPFVKIVHARLKNLPELKNLPIEVKKRKHRDLWELFIKVDKKHLRMVLKKLREYKLEYIEVV